MRDSSPNDAVHSITHASWLCSTTWLWTKIVATSGSSPIAYIIAARRSVSLADHARRLGDGERVQVDDAVERVAEVLVVGPVPQRTQVVAEVDVTGRLDAREHAGHGA